MTTAEQFDVLIREGVAPERAEEQLRLLKRGTKTIELASSASIGNGLRKLESAEALSYAEAYMSAKEGLKVMKFIPASGAASRMFKDLLTEYNSGVSSDASRKFKSRYSELPMFHGMDKPQDDEALFQLMFQTWRVQEWPKGTIPFHTYPEGDRTAFEEHLVEGIAYASSQGMVHLHFTIAPEHLENIKARMAHWALHYGKIHDVVFDVTFSSQDPLTDTFALESNGDIARKSHGSILWRPGGHGSLIHNLDTIDADIIFIKNVDNVAPDHLKDDTLLYKKALAGLLLELRERAREVRASLISNPDEQNMTKARGLLADFGIDITPEKAVSLETLSRLLDRPFRVCGMVPNQGEPGGGPFWVQHSGYQTLQIVESAQVDPEDPDQWRKLKGGTHFNPVDLVCFTKDLDGRTRSILEYRDTDTAFVTSKSYEGHSLTVLEWPGLWNGAMADWNTVFVEVPISTFTPVKTINDLFRSSHSSKS